MYARMYCTCKDYKWEEECIINVHHVSIALTFTGTGWSKQSPPVAVGQDMLPAVVGWTFRFNRKVAQRLHHDVHMHSNENLKTNNRKNDGPFVWAHHKADTPPPSLPTPPLTLSRSSQAPKFALVLSDQSNYTCTSVCQHDRSAPWRHHCSGYWSSSERAVCTWVRAMEPGKHLT